MTTERMFGRGGRPERSLFRGEGGEARIGEDPALNELHDIEGGADHGEIQAEAEDFRDRDLGALEGPEDPVLPLHIVGGGTPLAGGGSSQHMAVRP